MNKNRAGIAVMLCVTGGVLAASDSLASPKTLIAWGLCTLGWILTLVPAKGARK